MKYLIIVSAVLAGCATAPGLEPDLPPVQPPETAPAPRSENVAIAGLMENARADAAAGRLANAAATLERALRIDELLKKVGLPNHAQKYPAEMSGGMQQRLQIARCLAQEPKALLMDEPFGALDAMTRQGLQDEVLALVRASDATVIFVTHDLEEAIYLGDRVIGLSPHPGRIGIELRIDLPRPRDQLRTRENPEFLRLRRELFDFIRASET